MLDNGFKNDVLNTISKRFISIASLAIILISAAFSSPQKADAQLGDVYQDIIMATKDGGQGLQGEYKLRFASISNVEKEERDGGQGKGTISFSGNTVNVSVLGIESDGDLISGNFTGTFAASSNGYTMTMGSGPSENYFLNLSQDGEFLMITRGEMEGSDSMHDQLVCVRNNPQRLFTDQDISGTWRFRNFNLYDIEDNFDREAEICYGNLVAGSGQGTLQITCIEWDLNSESGTIPVSYTLQGNGETAFYFPGEQTPFFKGQLSSDGRYMITSSEESDTQQISVAMKKDPSKIHSTAGLTGTYRFQVLRVKNFSSSSPRAYSGYGTINFDGAGNWTGSSPYFFSSNGQISSGVFSGTYLVSPDGTVTMNTTSGGLGPNDVLTGYISSDDRTLVLTRAVSVAGSTKYGSLRVFIEPEGARNAGAQWRRSGTSTWYNSGQVESGVAVGTHSVEFKSVTGWIKPANSNVSIIENQTATVNGTYAVQGGTVFVDVTPDHAWWSLSGPAGFEGNGTFYSGDWTFNNAPPGSYTWSAQYDLANYDAPGPETKFLSLGGSISFYKAWTQTPPVAHFSATPAQGISPLIVSFTDLSTGTIHTRMWSFGDGSTAINETTPVHIYQNPGTYQATLTVAGPLASSPPENATYTIEINVNYPPPSAKFSMNPFRGEAPLQVNFSDQSTGEITSRNWTFGDGETSTEQNPQHIFNNLGLYSVTLDVTGPGGTSRTEGTVIIYKTLYVNKSDETCGGKSPCFTSIQAALGSPEQVKMIKVTQGPYQEEIQNTQNHTAIIQGGNDAAFQSTPSTSSVTKITGTAGALIPENIAVGAQ